MKLSKITILVLTLLALLAIQITVVAKKNLKQSNILAEISFPKDEGAIFLPVTLAGKKYMFILDTGATHNAYDSSLKKYLGSPLGGGDVGTASGTASVSMFNSPDAKLGRLKLKTKTPVMCYNFSRLTSIIGRRIHGALGMSFLKKYVVKIDFDKGKVVFYGSLNRSCVKGYSSFALRNSNGDKKVWVRVLIPGGNIWFMIDTGDGSNGSLAEIVFNSLVNNNNIGRLDNSLFRSLNEVITRREGLLDSFFLSPFLNNKLSFSSGIESKIGLAYLSRYSIMFDFPNKMIYLKKRKTYRRDISFKSGIALIRKDGKNIVYSVKKNSFAAKAGLKKGDILIAVDGKNGNKFTLHMLRRYLEKLGSSIKLKISRKGRFLQLQLKSKANLKG